MRKQKRLSPKEKEDRAIETIKRTMDLNEKLRQMGLVSSSFGLKNSKKRMD